MGIDNIDLKILYCLDENARQSNQQIARKIRTSKEVVAYRIKNLEKKNIIRGYQTIINTSKLGFNLYRVFLKLTNTNHEMIDEMINFLKREPLVWWIGELEGRWDFLFGVWAKNPRDFKTFFDKFNLKFRKYIGERLISILLSYQHYNQSYLIKKRENFNCRSIEDSEIEEIDKTDIKILKLISNNAKIPIIELASKLNLKSSTIIYRLKILEKKEIIRGYRSILNFSLLGYDYYVIKINLNDIKDVDKLKEFLLQNPHVTDVIETIAGYDFDFDMMVNNQKDYYNFIMEIKNKFPVREIEYFRVLNNYKLVYFPEF